jgi:hypothetical protein
VFSIYHGNVGMLPMNENYLAFKWEKPNTHILFSVCQQGKGVRVHFTAERKSLRYLKQAVNEFCHFCFHLFSLCEIIFAIIYTKRKSIIKLAEKCGFKQLATIRDLTILTKERPCHS